jgi:1-acyl-sn-glycerol-3-phosphate acyltransferase
MLALLAIAGYGLGGIALALVFPIVAIAIWSVWMAPTSKRRLRNPSRLTVQGALFVCTAGLYGGVGSLWVGITFAVIAFGVFAELARRE